MRCKPVTDENGLSLLGGKWKGGPLQLVFSRLGLIAVLILVQAFFLFSLWRWLGETMAKFAFGGSTLFVLIVFLLLIGGKADPTSKISWLVLIGTFPIFGTLFYAWTQTELGHREVKKRVISVITESRKSITQNADYINDLTKRDPETSSLVTYMQRDDGYCAYENTKVTYFPLGEKMWDEMIRQLETAEHFIFLEYFIVQEGLMWGKILEILARKVKEGVDVRVMYDGMCELSLLPADYPELMMKELNIPCRMFSPLRPFVSTTFNYRDHRKILVIDGKISFTGGVNLSDEYINHTVHYGHWKDTAVMLEGEAVKSFTLMFLQMWHVCDREKIEAGKNEVWTAEAHKFLNVEIEKPDDVKADDAKGFVVPYGDVPLDDDRVGEAVYMHILNTATKYVYIMTPYLILDGELESALRFTAMRGVDVRIILPGIPDKKFPYALARSHYRSLISAGVKIYEYTPGFVHAKVFVSDDCKAVVGTINLDYRSLYHHFECAAFMEDVPCIKDIKEDFDATQTKCRSVSMDDVRHFSLMTKIEGLAGRIVAPLM